MSETKRQDLQGIRGFAIFAVLLFHFFPEQFPNGYIGVDQFFVLSGYLIAIVLNKEDSFGLESMTLFCYRRIRRILPLYIFCILSTLIALMSIFPDLIFEKNSESAWSALLFLTNLRGNDPQKQYFLLLTLAEDAFAHTWSLAVEMQFYLLVPMFFFVLRRVPIQFKSFLIASVVLLSGIYHVTTDNYSSFNSVFARLWQFFSGIYGFYYTQSSDKLLLGNRDTTENEEILLLNPDSNQRTSAKKKRMESYSVVFCCMTILLVSLFPFKIPDFILRITVSLLTVIMMMAGSSAQNILVSNKPICYLGDISYAVYLVHWPIYSYCKLNSEVYTSNVCHVGFVFSIVVGIVLTETYEKFYLNLTQQNIFLLIIGLYVCCFCLLIPSRVDTSNEIVVEKPKKENWTKEEVINTHNRILLNDAITVQLTHQCLNEKNISVIYEPCEFEGLGHGTKQMMIIGNSWAANNAPTIHNKCGKKASRMTMFSPSNCEALVHTKHCCEEFNCPMQHERLLQVVQRDEPDVLFMMFRHLELFVSKPQNETKDYLVEYATKRLKKYEEVVKENIFILDAMPRNTEQLLRKLNEALKESRTVTQSDVDTGDDWRLARSRLKKIVATCRKCELIDYMPAFSENGEFRFFDNSTKMSYFSHGKHLTVYGKKLTEPVIEQICKRF